MATVKDDDNTYTNPVSKLAIDTHVPYGAKIWQGRTLKRTSLNIFPSQTPDSLYPIFSKMFDSPKFYPAIIWTIQFFKCQSNPLVIIWFVKWGSRDNKDICGQSKGATIHNITHSNYGVQIVEQKITISEATMITALVVNRAVPIITGNILGLWLLHWHKTELIGCYCANNWLYPCNIDCWVFISKWTSNYNFLQ